MSEAPALPAETAAVVIIGAGVIGCSAAWHLLQAGARDVVVIEANQPGSGSSSAGAGFVSHWSAGMAPMGREGLTLQQYGIDFYQRLQGRRDIGCRRSGTLIMALTEAGYDRHVTPILDSEYAPASMRQLDAAGIGEVMQGVVATGEVYGAALNPEGIQIETGLTIAALVGEIEALGGRFLTGETVEAVEESSTTGVLLTTSRRRIRAEQVILACGAWTNQVLAMVGESVPQMRMLASRIVTQDLGLPRDVPTVQCREIPIWLRESGGGLTWGTTDGYRPMHLVEADGYASPLGQPHLPQFIERLETRQHGDLERIFPPLKQARVSSWLQGYPCYTPDRDLIIGRLPGHEAILVATGDNETGVTHGPGIGRLVSEMALGQATIVDPHRYRLERFDTREQSEAAITAALDLPALTEGPLSSRR